MILKLEILIETPSREAGRLTADLQLSLKASQSISQSNPPALQQNTRGRFISGGSHRYYPPNFPGPICCFVPHPPQLQQALPDNSQVTLARKTGRLTVNPHLSSIFLKSNPSISSPVLQQTFCYGMFSLSALIPGELNKQILVENLAFLLLENSLHIPQFISNPTSQVTILRNTFYFGPLVPTLSGPQKILLQSTQSIQTLKNQRGNRNQPKKKIYPMKTGPKISPKITIFPVPEA